MQEKVRDNIQYFYVIGISYRKSSVEIREKFALSIDTQKLMLQDAINHNIDGLVVISTCNRTELYVYTKEEEKALMFFLQYCKGDVADFEKYGYFINGHTAITHVFKVSTGLDSQILGDVQIINQVKKSFRSSAEIGILNTFLERMFQHISRACKQIKRETSLSAGAASVASAAVQTVKYCSKNFSLEKIVLFGIGKIGKIACQNLLKNIDAQNIVIINRSLQRAKNVAQNLGVRYANATDLNKELQNATTLIVATGAEEYTVNIENVSGFEGTIVDLSMPRNVNPCVANNSGIRLTTIDDLTEVCDEVRIQRENSIPLANAIIEDMINEFYTWLQIKYLSPVFAELKKSLYKIKDTEIAYHQEKICENDIKRVDQMCSNIVDKVAELCIAHLKDYHKNKMTPIETIEAIFKIK